MAATSITASGQAFALGFLSTSVLSPGLGVSEILGWPKHFDSALKLFFQPGPAVYFLCLFTASFSFSTSFALFLPTPALIPAPATVLNWSCVSPSAVKQLDTSRPYSSASGPLSSASSSAVRLKAALPLQQLSLEMNLTALPLLTLDHYFLAVSAAASRYQPSPYC